MGRGWLPGCGWAKKTEKGKRDREGELEGFFGTLNFLNLSVLKTNHTFKQNKCKGMNASNTW
jgi:hypothetical protein